MPVYLKQDQLTESFRAAEKAARLHHQPFDEFERLAANKLRSDLPANMPKVNDGSLAALMLETPMRVVPQLQTGTVKATDRDEAWVGELGNVIWNKKIVPNANTQAPFLSKVQTWLYRALIYGAQPAYSFYTMRGEYAGADFTLPYVKDVYLEPGKVSDADSDYIFLKTYYTKLRLQNIIEDARKEARKAKEDGVDPMVAWDISALKEILEAGPEGKESENQTRPERDGKGADESYYCLVTCFQRGLDAPFYTFSPKHEGKIVRTSKNTNPCGDMPITFLYAHQDLVNPYGKGQVEISGGTQNVLDYMTQLHVLGTQIGLQPPVKVKGDRSQVDLKSIVYSPRAFWFTGQADVDQVQLQNGMYSQFPNTYGLYKTQLMNLQGTSDATVSGESGNPQYSKTDAGVNMQQERTNAHDNFLRSRVNEAVEKLAKNLINIHMANMHGTEVMKLVDEEAEKLMKAGLIDEDPETGAPSTQEIEVVWENMRGKFEFEVDADSSIAKSDEEQHAKIMEAITLFAERPELAQMLQMTGWKVDLGELVKRDLMTLGIKDWEKVLTQVTPEDMQAQMGQEMAGQPPVGGEQLPPEDMPLEEAPMQAPVDEADPDVAVMQQELAMTMEQYQTDQQTAAVIMQARREGFGEEEIADYLTQRGEA